MLAARIKGIALAVGTCYKSNSERSFTPVASTGHTLHRAQDPILREWWII